MQEGGKIMTLSCYFIQTIHIFLFILIAQYSSGLSFKKLSCISLLGTHESYHTISYHITPHYMHCWPSFNTCTNNLDFLGDVDTLTDVYACQRMHIITPDHLISWHTHTRAYMHIHVY